MFLGALSALCDRVSVENVQEAIRQYMPAKLHAKNIAIVDAAREAMGEARSRVKRPLVILSARSMKTKLPRDAS